ncbi:hypothetical protein [Draconibacterium halophilum]|uniref:Low-complexity protein n=1 Tax=Draconibacterium halophilum TaxID=2706887 RepID=A0A6C0RHG6_9BACT|nr:hypothetical protein [Draconibacterium halophilum]QIA09446.1 hypothetical protein G0Q07_17805 [Draconibacterium halophilum]
MKKVLFLLAFVAVYGVSLAMTEATVVTNDEIVQVVDNADKVEKETEEGKKATKSEAKAKGEGCSDSKAKAKADGCSGEKSAEKKGDCSKTCGGEKSGKS